MLLLKPYQLTVLTTSQCTARCGHCSVSSGPDRRDKLSFEQIREAIDQLCAVSPLSLVIFAGGEPTLLGEHLYNSIAYADSLGLSTRMVTNASWATSQERARAKITEFRECGLRELNISADDFHLPFIPFSRVINAWNASKGMGFLSVCIANCSGPRSVVTPQYICDQIGEDLPTIYDEDGDRAAIASPSSDGTAYMLSNARLQRLGRAHATIPYDDIPLASSETALDTPCPWAVRSAALSPKNHLVACCGMEAEHNQVLDFGDASNNPVAELVARADNDVLVNSIAYMGPMFLKRFIQSKAPEVSFRECYGAVCELCEHIVSRSETVDVLRRHSAELAEHVLTIRSTLIEKSQ